MFTVSKAKALYPIIEAYANGKAIQCRGNSPSSPWNGISTPAFSDPADQYRITPEPRLAFFNVLKDSNEAEYLSSPYATEALAKRNVGSLSPLVGTIKMVEAPGSVEPEGATSKEQREKLKALLPIIKAFSEGKAIQHTSSMGRVWTDDTSPTFRCPASHYQIKPVPRVPRVMVAPEYKRLDGSTYLAGTLYEAKDRGACSINHPSAERIVEFVEKLA